ncbi:MAG: hypothetical protein HUK26_09975, partial [Duodenibacillus sp.]|nr:hypothetical protein [Duodenibacillus sp.]
MLNHADRGAAAHSDSHGASQDASGTAQEGAVPPRAGRGPRPAGAPMSAAETRAAFMQLEALNQDCLRIALAHREAVEAVLALLDSALHPEARLEGEEDGRKNRVTLADVVAASLAEGRAVGAEEAAGLAASCAARLADGRPEDARALLSAYAFKARALKAAVEAAPEAANDPAYLRAEAGRLAVRDGIILSNRRLVEHLRRGYCAVNDERGED